METVNEAALEWREYEHGETTFRRQELSNATDGEELGCSHYEIPAGHRSWPYHYHTGNEEAIYVLAGSGRLRGPEGDVDLTPGTYASLPADERGAHQLVASEDESLRYLAISTMNDPDVTVYPEMEKIGVYAGSPPGSRAERTVEGYYPIDATVDYWDD